MPDTIYLYEHKSLGKWWPRTEPQPPQMRTSEGKRRHIRGVIAVDPGHMDYSLNALREIYSCDGRLIYTQGVEHVRRVRGD